jgi:hypothetical protein
MHANHGLIGAFAASAIFIAFVACNGSAVGVEACKSIEHARCLNAPACGIALTSPTSRDGIGHELDACVRYYDDACKHGLASKNDPGTAAVQACVDAINHGSCNVVEAPESDPACAFLIPPVTSDDGGTEAEAEADGASE